MPKLPGLHPALLRATIAGKGQGILAKHKIRAGTTLFQEKPLCVGYLSSDLRKGMAPLSSDMPIIPQVLSLTTGTESASLTALAELHPKCWEDLSDSEQLRFVRYFPPRDPDISREGNLSDMLRDETLQKMMLPLAKILANSLEFRKSLRHQPSLALFPTISYLNHSCWPNATLSVTGVFPALAPYREISVMACRDIEEDEEVCISYINVAMDPASRQDMIKKAYGFMCTCARCNCNGSHPVDMLLGATLLENTAQHVPPRLQFERQCAAEIAQAEFTSLIDSRCTITQLVAAYVASTCTQLPTNFKTIELRQQLLDCVAERLINNISNVSQKDAAFLSSVATMHTQYTTFAYPNFSPWQFRCGLSALQAVLRSTLDIGVRNELDRVLSSPPFSQVLAWQRHFPPDTLATDEVWN